MDGWRPSPRFRWSGLLLLLLLETFQTFRFCSPITRNNFLSTLLLTIRTYLRLGAVCRPFRVFFVRSSRLHTFDALLSRLSTCAPFFLSQPQPQPQPQSLSLSLSQSPATAVFVLGLCIVHVYTYSECLSRWMKAALGDVGSFFLSLSLSSSVRLVCVGCCYGEPKKEAPLLRSFSLSSADGWRRRFSPSVVIHRRCFRVTSCWRPENRGKNAALPPIRHKQKPRRVSEPSVKKRSLIISSCGHGREF